MIRIRIGQIEEILEDYQDLTILKVLVEGERAKAVHYPKITGSVRVGQQVVLNTTAKKMGLGTGGYHFVLYPLGNDDFDPPEEGHIMKLRYTPYQVKLLSEEEGDSPHHQRLKEEDKIDGLPVIVAPLHSMITPIVAVARHYEPDIKIGYLMSDGGALPLPLSKLVRSLVERNWLAGTITFGHAFGGDLEAVNIYTALLMAYHILEVDLAIVAMGPGIVGTGTPYGFSGTEQAHFLHAIHQLEGQPIAVPRISFADKRERHWGISHHSQTVLGKLALVESQLALLEDDGEKGQLIGEQLHESGIGQKHQIKYYPASLVEHILDDKSLKLRTMGRNYNEAREFFNTAGLAGYLAVENLRDKEY